MHTFALYPIVDGRCGCSDPECKQAGKHPAEKWRSLPERPELVATETRGIGIATGERSGFFVVDLDVKGDVNGAKTLQALGDVPTTYTVQTPSGGLHLYFKHPGFQVRNSGPKSNPLGPGIDIRGDGGFVVAPGSPHKNGGRYEVAIDAPLAEAPVWLLAWPGLRRAEASEVAPPANDIETVVGARVPKEWRIAGAKAALERIAPAIEGQGGDAHTWQTVARIVHEWCLTDQHMIDEAFVQWNDRCDPPWSGEQWRHKVTDVLSKSTTPWGTFALVARHASAEPAPTPSPETELDTWGLINWDAFDPEIRWIVHDIVQESTVSLAFGAPNSLKTWALYLMGSAVGRGEAWLGRAVTQGLVVILDYESSPRQARRRMRLLKQQGLTNVRYVNPSEMLDNPELWIRLAKLKPTLVIADSLSRGMLGRDENDSAAMAKPLDFAKRLARQCDTATVLIHHKNKSAREGFESARGASGIVAAAEGWLEFLDFEKLAGGTQRVRLHCGRLKESVPFDDILLELSDKRGLVEIPDEVKPVEETNEQRLFRILENNRSGFLKQTLIECLIGQEKERRKFVNELVGSGVLHQFTHAGSKALWVMLNPNLP